MHFPACHFPAVVRRTCFLLVNAYLAVVTGCAGYQFGNQALYRPDIRTVYVPMFESDSLRRELSERLTEAVVKEIESRTPYKVISDPGADSILTGRLLAEQKRVVAENLHDEPRDLEVLLTVQVHWVDRRGLLIMQNVALPVSPSHLFIQQSENLIPEAGQSIDTAHQEAVEELAQQIVNQMEMRW